MFSLSHKLFTDLPRLDGFNPVTVAAILVYMNDKIVYVICFSVICLHESGLRFSSYQPKASFPVIAKTGSQLACI